MTAWQCVAGLLQLCDGTARKRASRYLKTEELAGGHFRDQLIAASLKPVTMAGVTISAPFFRDQLIAASLKLCSAVPYHFAHL